MNIQDIADFIDLVKNPAKYETVLQNITDEKARLNAVIETVGKVSEIEKIKKETEAKAVSLESEHKNKMDSLVSVYTNKLKKVETLQTRLESSATKATADEAEAGKKLQEAKQLTATLAAREKTAAQVESDLVSKQTELDKLIADYTEKVAKLKAVMN